MKIVFFVLLFFFFTYQMYSQTRFGIKGGLNNSTLTNTLLDYKKGAYFGILFDIPIKRLYTMQPELYYSSQGGKSNSSDFGNLNIDYISVSFANKFYLTNGKNIHLILGPSLDYFVSKQIGLRSGFGEDVSITPLDFTVFVGIGLEFGFGLTIETRFKQGLTSTDFFGSRNEFELDGSQLNQVFQVGLTYKIKLE